MGIFYAKYRANKFANHLSCSNENYIIKYIQFFGTERQKYDNQF